MLHSCRALPGIRPRVEDAVTSTGQQSAGTSHPSSSTLGSTPHRLERVRGRDAAHEEVVEDVHGISRVQDPSIVRVGRLRARERPPPWKRWIRVTMASERPTLPSPSVSPRLKYGIPPCSEKMHIRARGAARSRGDRHSPRPVEVEGAEVVPPVLVGLVALVHSTVVAPPACSTVYATSRRPVPRDGPPRVDPVGSGAGSSKSYV